MVLKDRDKRRLTIGAKIGFVAVCLLASIVAFISCNHKPAQDVSFFSSKEIGKLQDGWILYDGDNQYSISLPSKDEIDVVNNQVTLVNRLPDTLPVDASILFRTSLQGVEVFIDGKSVYQYGGDEYRAFGHNNGSIWNVIPLSANDAKKEIKLQIDSPYKSYKSTFNTFYIGSYPALIGQLFRSYGINILFIFITAIVGIALLIYYVCLRIGGLTISDQMLYISLVAIFTSAWEFTECKLTQVLVGNMAGFSTCNFLFLAVMPIPMVLYVNAIEKEYYSHVAIPNVVLMELNVVFQLVMQLTGVTDFYNMMPISHALIVISAVSMYVTLFRKYRKHRQSDLLIILITFTVLVVGGIAEILLTYVTGYVGGTILIVAVMLVILATGLESVRAALLNMQATKAALEESAAKTTFLANMSHELRTPMNAISAMSELLMSAEDMTAGNRDFAKIIHSSADNLLEIINDLLDFSKISANRIDIADEDYAIWELVSDVREIMAVRASEKGLDFKIAVNPNLPYELKGDCGKLRQILVNLLNNAIKYTEKGEVTLKLDFDMLDDRRIRIKMSVSDTGVGIKPEDMNDLFEAFVQVDNKARDRSNEGTGLGLAISRALAVMLDGTILVESEYGAGSTFVATAVQTVRNSRTIKQEIATFFGSTSVPPVVLVDSGFETTGYYKHVLAECGATYVAVSEDEVADEIFLKDSPIVLFATADHPYLLSDDFRGACPNARPIGVAGGLEKVKATGNCEIVRMPFNCTDLLLLTRSLPKERAAISFAAPEAKVMVVDDNVINLKVMKEMLHKFGIKATMCSNGTQAVAAMKLKKFDVIFMDHMMPGMDGIETAGIIRKIPEDGDRVKIVALTANAVKGIDKMFKENGFDAYVSKPVSLNEIGKVLQKNLPKELIINID